MKLDNLPVNAFDLVLVAVIVASIFRGRRVGMSGELLSLLTWSGIIVACAFAYQPLGQVLQQAGLMGRLGSYIFAYVLAGCVVFLIGLVLNRIFGGVLIKSDVFGPSEYYLGMVSSVIRSFCILLTVLAIINSRYYSKAEIMAEEKFQNDVYGSNFFPTLHTVQATVFEKSIAGSAIKNYLGFLLIKPIEPQEQPIKRREATTF
jgi:uncharacterized membrane protein required for colicin V production